MTLATRPATTILTVADEGRAKFNLPALGGDAARLVTPLNVLVGGQASPRDTGSQNETGKVDRLPSAKHFGALLKAESTAPQRQKVAEVLAAFFKRQGKAVLSKIGAGGDWWDEKRWNDELADDLHRVAHTLAGILGKAEAERLGYPEGFDDARTVNFLRAVAERQAADINATTKAQVEAAISSDGGDPARVFEVAETSRADGVGAKVAVFVAGFATVEAAKHIASSEGVRPTKTWVTGPNPRPEHSAMDGETVPIDEPFSNGEDWPGGLPGCNCSVATSIP